MKQPDIDRIAQHYSAILTELGADLTSEGMRETPRRAAKSLVEMTEGSRMDTAQLTTMFKAECQKAVCHDMVIVEGIREVGLCEHHLLPIIMSITVAYVPDQKILGLSKVARIAGYFARRWQNQERTAHLIAEFVEKTVEALGVAVLIDGKHLCAMARGVRDTHSVMKVIVKVEPESSSRVALLVRVASARRSISFEISATLFLSASRTTGTMRPASVLVARPMCTWPRCTISPAASSRAALSCGNLRSAYAVALTMKGRNVTLRTPVAWGVLASAAFTFSRSATSSVQSTSST